MAQDPAARRSSKNLSEAAKAAREQLSPKYVQLRGDQQIELDVVARELQAARTHKGERITANTVIRVAVDAILAHREHLVGDTEEELRTNLLDYIDELQKRPTGSREDEG
ncbi:chromosome segregation ATPase [Streptomyces sioyaensis]|uniref:chromosome segregation ATPase n=1 Tax=Streptomyces sioyaensis TaxID=67364 RepID=UPI0033DB9917